MKKKGVVIHDIYNHMSIKVDSLREACRWFYNNNLAKSEASALANVQNSIKDKRVIYKRYYLTVEKE